MIIKSKILQGSYKTIVTMWMKVESLLIKIKIIKIRTLMETTIKL